MDLRTKIGQLFVYTAGKSRSVGHAERDFLRHYRPGGLIYPTGQTAHTSRRQIARYVADLQAVNEELGLPGPLIVCVDHRGGDATLLPPEKGGLEFPAPIAQAALGHDAERAGAAIGAAIARDALDVGFNLNLSPYADFLQRGDIKQFVFGNSMMGADPAVNAALSVGLIRGIHSEEMRATYCVFPGGYGSLPQDPHHEPGIIEADRQELEARYFLAPRAAFAAEVDAVMLSHFAFPALDPVDQGTMAYWLGRSMTWLRRPTDWRACAANRLAVVAGWTHFLDAAGEVFGAQVRTLRLPVRNTRNEVADFALNTRDAITDEGDEVALLLQLTGDADLVIFGASSAQELRIAQALHHAGRIVWVVHAGRVFAVQETPALPVVLLSYSHGPYACRKALEVFAGQVEATGQLPVPLA